MEQEAGNKEVKIGNFGMQMQGSKRKGSSDFAAILKTMGFFLALGGMVWLFVYYGTSGKNNTEKVGYQRLEVTQLSNYEYYVAPPGEPADPAKAAANKIPDDVMALAGKRFAITGFMLPVDVDDDGNVTQFAINGNYDACFYGAPSSINQWVYIVMKEGKKAPFSHRPITVYGTLEVGEEIKDGVVASLYRMRADDVKGERGGAKTN
jgi:hypothetical protein